MNRSNPMRGESSFRITNPLIAFIVRRLTSTGSAALTSIAADKAEIVASNRENTLTTQVVAVRDETKLAGFRFLDLYSITIAKRLYAMLGLFGVNSEIDCFLCASRGFNPGMAPVKHTSEAFCIQSYFIALYSLSLFQRCRLHWPEISILLSRLAASITTCHSQSTHLICLPI
jgi:hypothetical protein